MAGRRLSSAAVRCPRLGSDVIFVLNADGSSEVDGCPYFSDGMCTIPSATPLGRLPRLSHEDLRNGQYVCPRCGNPLLLTPQGIYVCPFDGSAYQPPEGISTPCLFYVPAGRRRASMMKGQEPEKRSPARRITDAGLAQLKLNHVLCLRPGRN
ncbi:MAG: hypothetical protein RXR41_05495 [Candidatus Marsarchaeota archaeon]